MGMCSCLGYSGIRVLHLDLSLADKAGGKGLIRTCCPFVRGVRVSSTFGA